MMHARLRLVTLTGIAPEILLDYSTSTVSCTGISPLCFVQIYPYTYTETWSAQTTPIIPLSTTATSYVAYANSGTTGGIVVLSMLILLVGGIALLARIIQIYSYLGYAFLEIGLFSDKICARGSYEIIVVIFCV